jgi:hypothetical protein
MAAAAVVLAFAGAAAAADIPRAEGFGGYSYGRALDQDLHGWSAVLGYNFTRHVEAEAEIGAHYGTLDGGTSLSRQAFLAGPRLNFRAGRATPFLRALAGAVRTSEGITVQGVSIAARRTALGAAAGGGIDLGLGRHWGLRASGDYFLVRADGEMVGDARAAVGISYRLGQKGITPAR